MSRKIPLFLVAAAILSAAALSQSPPAGRTFVTLGPHEHIVSEESCLLASGGCLADDFFVVTREDVGGKTVYYTYDKSGRKGPFDKITENMLRSCAGNVEPRKFYRDEEASMEGLNMAPDSAKPENQYVEFQGQRIGPFQQVYAMVAAPDKSRAFAAGVRDKKLHFASTDGRDVVAVGMPDKIVLTGDAGKAVLLCKGTLTMYPGLDLKPESMDLSHADDTTLFTLDGKKFGPFAEAAAFGDVWALAHSPDWLFTVGPTAYFNGAPLKTFAEPISKSRFWIDDASHYGWLQEEKLMFSDGASFPNPVMLQWEKKGGRTTICWISILPNRNVVGYSRTL